MDKEKGEEKRTLSHPNPVDDSVDGRSEVASLFHQALRDHMTDDEANTYLSSLLDDEGLASPKERLFEHIEHQAPPDQLLVTNYHPDRAVREASLAKQEEWQQTIQGNVKYLASNQLEVFFGAPLEIPEALKKIRQLNESTVLTARIVLGLWNRRRYNHQVSHEGDVAILLDEILQWQGIQKHSRTAHPGTQKRYTDGYRTEHRRRVLNDLALLASCNVRGTCELTIRGKTTSIQVDGPYLRYDTVSRKSSDGAIIILGVLVSPGGWIGTYEQYQNETLAQIDRQIFTLNPQNDRYALRIALYLTERWREQAKPGHFSTPISMSELLAASMIDVDPKNLNKQAPAIEKALAMLEHMHILQHQCLSGFHIGIKEQEDGTWKTNTCMKIHRHGEDCETATATSSRWSQEWLASTWEILPPPELIKAYESLLTPRRKRGRKPRNGK